MAVGRIHEQDTIPVRNESQNAPKKEQDPSEPLTIQDILVYFFAAVSGYAIINFIYTEAVNFIKELGQ